VTLDLDRFRTELETERVRLTAAREAVNHPGSLAEETGELASGAGDHLGDHASEVFQRELDNGLEENAEHIVSEIDAALGRIESGTYGTCVVCGKPIGAERLEAVPWATLCIDDQRRLERG
jgi:RNA polymerase-binding transcription factor